MTKFQITTTSQEDGCVIEELVVTADDNLEALGLAVDMFKRSDNHSGVTALDISVQELY